MNLSRLVGITKSKKRSDQSESSSSQQQLAQQSNNMWDDCLVENAPSEATFNQEQASHLIQKAATETEYLDSLVKTIEGNILPLIMERHLESSGQPSVTSKEKLNQQVITELTTLVLQEDARTSVQYVKALHASGVSLEDIYLLLLAPVARKLGEMWDEDQSSFTDVTIALWRIKQLMYDLSPIFQQYAENNTAGPSIMLVPLPGSQHNLGLFMVSEFFAKAGWRIWGELAATEKDIISMASKEWFDVVGLSASLKEQLPQLKDLIKQIKLHSRNPHVGVIIGSPVFSQSPELVEGLGADMVGVDAEDALEKATFYVERLR